MITYKISPVLIFILLMQHICSIAQDFEPDNDGNYKYYATLSSDKVPNDFSKSQLMDLLYRDDKLPQKAVQQINKNIVRVKKAFPSAKSDFLQHSLIITANVNNLDLLVDKSSNTRWRRFVICALQLKNTDCKSSPAKPHLTTSFTRGYCSSTTTWLQIIWQDYSLRTPVKQCRRHDVMVASEAFANPKSRRDGVIIIFSATKAQSHKVSRICQQILDGSSIVFVT